MIAGEEAAGFALDFGAAVVSGTTVVMLKIVADVCTGARVTLSTLVDISPVDRVVSVRLMQKSISVLLLEGNAFTNPSGQASHVG